uniref:hypothetical protein n=1 Tax=Agrobacterium fabrum TaxID=1176649 RepID=UPI0021BD9904|nr:hypothetical protein [Agrobacterium fabrum]
MCQSCKVDRFVPNFFSISPGPATGPAQSSMRVGVANFVEPAAPFLHVYRLPQTSTSADLHRLFDRYLREHMTWLRSQLGDGGFHNMGEFRFIVGNPTLLLDRKARCYRRDHGHDLASRSKSRL